MKAQRPAPRAVGEHLLDLAARASGFGYWHADPQGTDVDWSREALDIIGAGSAEGPDLPGLVEMLHADDRQRAADALSKLRSRGASLDIEARLSAREDLSIGILAIAGRDGDGEIERIYGLVFEQGGLSGARAEIARGRDLLRAVLDSVSQGVAIFDSDLKLELWSKGFTELHNLQPGVLRPAMHMSDMMRIFAERGDYGEGDIERIVAERMDRVPKGAELREHCYERSLADGSIVEVHGRPLPNGGLITTYSDITAQNEAIADAQRRAFHDPLTGLPNRAKFIENLEDATLHAERNGTRLALLMLDLDHFKDINDTLGHPAGDALLVQAGERLLACARKTDTVARLGGDEFAIIGTDIMEEDGHERLARRILEAFAEPFVIGGAPITTGTSIGIAVFPIHTSVGCDEFISNADVALYDAKASGRHTFRVFDGEMKKVVKERQELESDLRQALDEDAFALFFQPQVDLATNRIIGAEALIRWNHPERGMVPPSVFIPLVERVRLIDPLTTIVLRKACEHLVEFDRAGHGDISVAVNASGLSLRSRALLDLIYEALDETAARHDRLEIEIAEGAWVNSAKGLAILHELSELGIGLALDDFGSGYSSLSRMRELPITKLKIDRSFLADATKDQRSAAMMQSMIEMGVRLGLRVICEGVETDAQLALLRKIACPAGQGYLLGKPMSFADFIDLADRMNASGSLPDPGRKSAA